MNKEAISELVTKMADDALIIGHRNSEWTGIGPILEEDLSFSSMAQDKVGHPLNLYTILHERMGFTDPDRFAFQREEKKFKSSQFVELPIGEFDFSLTRHFFFDHAEHLRYSALADSSFQPLAHLSKKIKGEIKYHIMHANTWMRNLANGNETSKARMQSCINELWPYALGVFEPGPNETALIEEGVFIGEEELQKQWTESVTNLLKEYGYAVPENVEPIYGGRNGYHSEHLKPLLDEMTEVVQMDPEANW